MSILSIFTRNKALDTKEQVLLEQAKELQWFAAKLLERKKELEVREKALELSINEWLKRTKCQST